MRVSVIGSGSWGTAAAGLAAANADSVTVWCRSPDVARSISDGHRNPRHLTGYALPENVTGTASLAAAADADAIILAAPSAFLRGVCHGMAPYVGDATPVCVLTKGVEPGTGDLMTDVVSGELGVPGRVACLSGPNHAEEICMGTVSAAVVASGSRAVANVFQDAMCSKSFRVYVTDDVTGVGICAAVKNVIAIACGVAVSGLGAGDNTVAVLMTRGLAETTRIACACGGRQITCMGLAGMGDLVATCTSVHSRNRTFGESLARGETLEQYQGRTHMVVEGAVAALSIHQLARRLGVEAPIVDAVHGMLYEGMPLADAVGSLLGHTPCEEFYGLP